MTIIHRRSCFHLCIYIYICIIYIYIFSSLHPGEMLLVRHLKAPSELIPLLCFWWFFFLTGSACPASFFHDKLCWSIFCIMDHEALQKHVWGRGANFNQFSFPKFLEMNQTHWIWFMYTFGIYVFVPWIQAAWTPWDLNISYWHRLPGVAPSVVSETRRKFPSNSLPQKVGGLDRYGSQQIHPP